jgi:hypothetical protein
MLRAAHHEFEGNANSTWRRAWWARAIEARAPLLAVAMSASPPPLAMPRGWHTQCIPAAACRAPARWLTARRQWTHPPARGLQLPTNMNSSARKRLQLNSETLQRLGADELVVAVGGKAQAGSGGSCLGFGCGLTGQCTVADNCGGAVPPRVGSPEK